MGYKENAERDRIAKANVQRLRDQRDAQARSDWWSSEQAENIQKIRANAAAKKAAQNGSCMMARTTLTMLTLSVVVLKAMSRQRSATPMACDDGGDGKWTVSDYDNGCDEKKWSILEPGHPSKKDLGCGI
jgi:hypothetical protein